MPSPSCPVTVLALSIMIHDPSRGYPSLLTLARLSHVALSCYHDTSRGYLLRVYCMRMPSSGDAAAGRV
jgi:hypothetical protein